MMKALLFGSIGVIVDASHLQLEAWNTAFAEAGLDWRWERSVYEPMLAQAGGQDRLRRYARETGRSIPSDDTIENLHRRKTELFDGWLLEGRAGARPGVRRLMDEATAAGVRLGFVTSTELDNVRATLEAAGDGVRLERFDVFTHRGNVALPKPDPAPWNKALEDLGIAAVDAVAIEDTVVCVRSARNAGLVCLATPNGFSGTQDFSAADAVVDSLGDIDAPARSLGGFDVLEEGLVTLERLAALAAKGGSSRPAFA